MGVLVNGSLPLHVSLPGGSPVHRGREFGRAQASRVQATVAGYRWMFHAECGLNDADVVRLGHDAASRLARSLPEMVDEITGIAEGAAVDAAWLMAVNARTEILGCVTRDECSTVGVVERVPRGTAPQSPLLAQNWDWHPVARDAVVVWIVPTGYGSWFVTVTEAGLIAKMGMSSSGLACCMNMLHSPDDGRLTGAPIHLLLRQVLASCTTVSEALAKLTSVEVGASTCITLASADGELVGVELSPANAGMVPPGPDGRYAHTNHFLAGGGGGGGGGGSGGQHRLER